MAKTVGEMIQELLCGRGVQEAASVEVMFKGGTRVTIHSDDSPHLNRDASEVESVTPKQTAEGGK